MSSARHPGPAADAPVRRTVAGSRRAFLRPALVGGSLLAVGPALLPVQGHLRAASAKQSSAGDLAAFAESIELVAATAYEAGMELLSDDLAPVLQTFVGHHGEHAATWAELAGDAATGKPNATLLEALTPTIEGFRSQNDVLRFARDLENQLSVTCGYLLGIFEGGESVTVAATILPVETAHAATLSYELQEGPAAWFPFGAAESADIVFGLDPAAFPLTGR